MPTADPFAPKTKTDEAQTEPSNESVFDSAPAEAPRKTTPRKASVKTAVTEDNTGVSVTFKAPGGNTAPWIVIHASSVGDALEQVKGENATALADLMERTAKANLEFAKHFPSAPAAGADKKGKPEAANDAPGGEVRTCKHGNRVYRTGVKNGKTWEAFFCPTDQGTPDQCKAQFKD